MTAVDASSADEQRLDALVERMSRAEALALLLSDRIVSKHVKPGERLGTKDELRQRYSVAAGTLNEAIRLLETRGLVAAKPGPRGGIFVSAPSVHVTLGHLILGLAEQALTVPDALEIRNALEVPLAVRASRNVKRVDARRLRRLLAAMEACSGSPSEYLRRNWDLHEAIAQLSDNELLRTIYLSLLDAARDSITDVRSDNDDENWWRANWQLHVELVEGIVSGDPERAARAAEAHTPMSALHGGAQQTGAGPGAVPAAD
jgi:DNA-binding FadR family transcriptional regulator